MLLCRLGSSLACETCGRSQSSGLQPLTWQSVVMGAEASCGVGCPRGGWRMTRLPERCSGRAPGVTSGPLSSPAGRRGLCRTCPLASESQEGIEFFWVRCCGQTFSRPRSSYRCSGDVIIVIWGSMLSMNISNFTIKTMSSSICWPCVQIFFK